jgi:hypothetical protein
MAKKSNRKLTPRPRPAKPRAKAGPKPRRAGRQGRPPRGTADWAATFLTALRWGLHVRDAAATALVSTVIAYRRRAEEPAFAEAWKKAQKVGTQEIEAEAMRRAYHGIEKPVLHKGKVIGYVREYSDRLMMFLLRGWKPEKYREHFHHTHGGDGGGPIPHQIGVGFFLPDAGSAKAKTGDRAQTSGTGADIAR